MAVDTLEVDGLTFAIQRSDRRKTLEIIVDRDGQLRIAAPHGLADNVMAEFAREKRFWIFTKLAEKEVRSQPVGAKEFVTGEGFLYLGRTHRLLLVDDYGPLRLERGRFVLPRSRTAQGRDLFIDWYSSRGERWLAGRLGRWAQRMSCHPTRLEVMDLGYRWGSCSRSGAVRFHWAVMLLPPPVIDYVITHELAHLEEKHHTPRFWALVERALPEYDQRRIWLAERGGAMVAL